MAKRCYYEVLGVERTAGDGDLKSAFRKLAMKWHRTVTLGDKTSETRFKEINGGVRNLEGCGQAGRL